LGLSWDAETDEFYFLSVKTDKPSTKRGILSVVNSLLDPLGFFTPFILSVKVHLWCQNIGWDAAMPQRELDTWQKWFLSIPQLAKIRIPRFYSATKIAF